MTTLLSVGDRVCPGLHAFQARFNGAIHFPGPDGLAILVDERIGAGPVNIVIRGGDLGTIETLSVQDRRLLIDGEPFDFGDQDIYCSAIAPLQRPGPRFRESLAVLEACIRQGAHPLSLAFLLGPVESGAFGGGFALEFARRMREGVQLMSCGDPAGGAALIRGCGYGLTPSGDDFIAGVLIALNALQAMDGRSRNDRIEAVFGACGKGSLLCDTYLKLAREGRVDQGMKVLISALVDGNPVGIRLGTQTVLGHGSSSGADLATGLLIALRGDTDTGDTNDG